MARALRSSGASGTSAAEPTVPASNGNTRARVLKRKRTGDDDASPKHTPRRDDTDSASPLTDLAPSPAVKDEADDDPRSEHGLNGDDHAAPDGAEQSEDVATAARSPTPGAFVDGCDQPPSATDAHKLLTVLQMCDTQNLLARHVPPADTTLRAMLKNPTHSIRSLKAAITALLPTQPHPRARLSLEQTAQRIFCELALGLVDEIAQKQPASKERTSIFQISAEHKSKHADDSKPTRYALQQTIYGTDYYTSTSADSLTLEKAASLATGQASLTAIIPAVPVPASAMPTLGAYTRKPVSYHSPWLGPHVTLSAMIDLSYGARCSFAPTYDSSGSAFTRSEIDDLIARRMKPSKAYGPPPPLPPPPASAADTDMTDAVPKSQKAEAASIHPDLVPVPALDPSLGSTAPSTSPSTPKVASTLDPSLDPDLCNALDTAFQELALEDSVRGLLESNARAMTHLVDLQNARLQKWNLRKPDLSVLDVGEGEELELARCIEKTLGLLAALRPRTILSSVPSESPTPTSLIPPASVLRALHRTLPTEPSPGYRGTLDPRREMSLRDDTTIKMANIPAPAPAPAPTPTTAVGTPRPAVPATPVGARPGYPAPAGSTYYGQQAYPQAQIGAGQYPQQGVYPQGQYAGYPQQQQSQYPVQYPAGAAGTQQVQQYPQTPATATGQQYPYPYPYSGAQPGATGTYPQTPATYPVQPAATGGYVPPTPGQATTYPAPAQAGAYPAQAQAGAYPTPTQAATYPTPNAAAAYPTPTPAAGVGTPRVITNVIKPATQGVWSPGQGYTPTTASVGTPATGYNAGYNPLAAAGAQGQYPTTAGAQAQYPAGTPAPGTAGYNYAAPGATGYTPSPTGAYAPTPVKPSAVPRGPIPPHVRSTPGTPASPSSFLPTQTYGTPANPTMAAFSPGQAQAPALPGYGAWNGQGTPATPRPAA